MVGHMTTDESSPVPELVQELIRRHQGERDRRQSKLADLLRELGGGPVLVMTANAGYNDMFTNWVRSCDRAGISVRDWSLFFAADDAAAKNAEHLGFRVFTDVRSYGEMPTKAVGSFGDADFRLLMFQKTAVVHDVVELGFDILFQDVDVVWRKDPRDVLLTDEPDRWDLRFMYDGDNPIHGPLHANTGFFWVRSTAATRAFWAGVLDAYPDIYDCGSQQSIVNRILGQSDLAIDILPEEQFANGHLFSIDEPSQLPDDPYVIHCSWTSNIVHKIQKYRREGLWYL